MSDPNSDPTPAASSPTGGADDTPNVVPNVVPNDAPDVAPNVVPVDLRDYVDFSRDEARRVRTLATDRLAVDLWCLEPGQATPVLRLPDQDVSYTVLGGRSWFVTDEGEIGLDPMGTLLVPAGVVHGIDNRGVDPLIVVASVSPPGGERPAAPVSEDAAAIRLDDDRPNALVRAWRGLLGVDRDRAG
jgi:quercetin dioxygenase-like cupin family protein